MLTIYKYPIKITDIQTVKVHLKGYAKIVHIGLDPVGTPCIWAEVDPEGELTECFTLYIVGTGHPLPELKSHEGSFQQGMFMWHVYM